MVIGFDRIAQVGCGHKPSSADADYFASKALLRVMICQVLDHRVGIDDIEAFVAKVERATIEDQRLHTRKTTLVILHFGQRNSVSRNLLAMFVQGFELFSKREIRRCSYDIEN